MYVNTDVVVLRLDPSDVGIATKRKKRRFHKNANAADYKPHTASIVCCLLLVAACVAFLLKPVYPWVHLYTAPCLLPTHAQRRCEDAYVLAAC